MGNPEESLFYLTKELRTVTFAANTNALEHTVASELVEYETGLDETRGLLLVGDDATDEVRVSAVQHGHQLVEGLAVHHGDGHEGARLSLLLATTVTTR